MYSIPKIHYTTIIMNKETAACLKKWKKGISINLFLYNKINSLIRFYQPSGQLDHINGQ